MNTLTYGATTLTLPEDMGWPDEYAWQAVEQRTQYTVTGALIVEAFAKQAGRPITLRSSREGNNIVAAIRKDVLGVLYAWAQLPAQPLSLVLRDATAFNVLFDHARGPIEAEPVRPEYDLDDEDLFLVTLRFLKV